MRFPETWEKSGATEEIEFESKCAFGQESSHMGYVILCSIGVKFWGKGMKSIISAHSFDVSYFVNMNKWTVEKTTPL